MKEIPLTQGRVATVDDCDYNMLISMGKWHCDNKGYARTNVWINGTRKSVKMHRIIMNTPIGMQTDHIDGNKTNNQRMNLRICTNAENMRNKGLRSTNTSGYKGVVKKKK